MDLVTYDPESGVFTSNASRGCIRSGDVIGAPGTDGYLSFGVGGVRMLAHRAAFLYVYGFLPKLVDHINGVTSDYRLSNLREADYFGNSRNSRPHANSKSRFKGVRFSVRTTWESRIYCNGASVTIGNFKSEIEAAYAYDMKSIEMHKDFGRRNFLPLM